MKLLVLVLLTLPIVATSQSVPKHTYHDLLQAQDLRDGMAMTGFLKDKNPSVRSRAAIACGSIQDTSHIDELVHLLSDPKEEIRSAAAFALGQLQFVADSAQRSLVSATLTKRLGFESNAQAVQRILEALGKIGDEYSLSVVVATGQSRTNPSVKAEAALAIGRYAYRGVKSKIATNFAAGLLAPSFKGQQWKAAYALMRIADASLFAAIETHLLQAASHSDPNVRMFVATALGKLEGSPKAVNALLSLTLSDKDWRVRVNAIKSMAKVEKDVFVRVLPRLCILTADSVDHVAITALSSLGEMKLGSTRFAPETRRALLGVMNDDGRYSQRRKREAAIAYARTFGVMSFQTLFESFTQNKLTKRSFIASLAHVSNHVAVRTLLDFLGDPNPQVQRETLESLQSCSKSAHEDSSLTELVKPAFVNALSLTDMSVIATAANALADSSFADVRSVGPLVAALRRLKSPEDSDAMVSIIQALGQLKALDAVAPLESELIDSDHVVAREATKALEQITGKSYKQMVPAAPPTQTNFDWNLLESIQKNPKVNVQTNEGSFVIQLLPDESPFTCMNFAALIRKGFFDGLIFHRVVPNFVIQGGDPRGDGWGGPGYTIRSEFGLEHYERGTVGVASSGKDTEGCQWFVTHSFTPHLDGRYSIFGKVISGLDIVDKIAIGDTITTMAFAK